MLKKGNRLSRTVVKNLLEKGGFFHTEHFLLRTTVSPLGPRVGVSVSKKVSKSAVTRNRVRRRAYAALAPLVPSLDKKLYLVVAKPSVALLKSEALTEELAVLLKKG